jgi:hypothetical protein
MGPFLLKTDLAGVLHKTVCSRMPIRSLIRANFSIIDANQAGGPNGWRRPPDRGVDARAGAGPSRKMPESGV